MYNFGACLCFSVAESMTYFARARVATLLIRSVPNVELAFSIECRVWLAVARHSRHRPYTFAPRNVPAIVDSTSLPPLLLVLKMGRLEIPILCSHIAREDNGGWRRLYRIRITRISQGRHPISSAVIISDESYRKTVDLYSFEWYAYLRFRFSTAMGVFVLSTFFVWDIRSCGSLVRMPCDFKCY